MRLLFDMSSILWTNLMAGKDEENGHEEPNVKEGLKPVWINSAAFGFENFVANLTTILKRHDAAPMDIVMVFDGHSSKLMRQQMFAGYKADRAHHPAYYEEFDKLRAKVRETLLGLGAIGAEQDGREADDVLAYFAKNLRSPHTIITNDGDLLALVGGHTSVDRGGDINENKYGPFAFKYITLYKALVGDTSDNIKGAVGFGDKKFIDLLCTFREEGLEALCDLIREKKLEELAEDVPELKCLQKIIDSKESVYTSWDLATLYPDRVNIARSPLQMTAGKLVPFDAATHDERLKHWYGGQRLVHAGNYNEAIAWAQVAMAQGQYVSLDIETSTPPESDQWLEDKNRAVDKEGEGRGVDVLGSDLTGLSLTFGKNQQYSFYLTADHVETDSCKNLSVEQVRNFVGQVPKGMHIVVHNGSFELSVLFQEWGEDWKDNGFHGFLPNVRDTMLEKSYVNENTKLGLKSCSLEILGYEQVSYAEVTGGVVDGVSVSGHVSSVGGRKMNQMTAAEVTAYGNDDTICTSALHNYFRLVMELENTWDVYEAVEIRPMYLHAMRFLKGTSFSLQHMNKLAADDQKQIDDAWVIVKEYITAHGWEGSVCPQATCGADITPAWIKGVYLIVTGNELKTKVRTPSKLFLLVKESAPELAEMLLSAFETGNCILLNEYVKAHFKGEAVLDINSPKEMQRLMYEVMGLPVRLRNPATDVMRSKGIKEGNPRADDLSIQFALKYDAETHADIMPVLKALQLMKSATTRFGLYYKPYRFARHWRDNKIHGSVGQCRTVTRRYAPSDPNLAQLPKHPKQGVPAHFRETYTPHKLGAVVVSMDFTAQELVRIAEESQDLNMLACYVGDNKKDMHSLTAIGIMLKKTPAELGRMIGREPTAEDAERWAAFDYEKFVAAVNTPTDPDYGLCKQLRAAGKKCNFTTTYGAQAPKVAETLVVTLDEAKQYVAAKYEAFPRAEAWKVEEIAVARAQGYALSALGARRHLPALNGSDKFAALQAERQAVNYRIQGSCAEQTKLAEGRLWESGIFYRYDAEFIAPIHDELVASVAVADLLPFLKEMHAAVTVPYAGAKIPTISSISFGSDFGNQIEVGETIDEGPVLTALEDLGLAGGLQRLAA